LSVAGHPAGRETSVAGSLTGGAMASRAGATVAITGVGLTGGRGRDVQSGRKARTASGRMIKLRPARSTASSRA